MKSLKGFIPAATAALVLMASGSFADTTPAAPPQMNTAQQAGGYGKGYGAANGGLSSMQGDRLRQRLGDRTGNPEDCPYYQERIKRGYQPMQRKRMYHGQRKVVRHAHHPTVPTIKR